MEIRPAVPDDADAAVALYDLVEPWSVTTADLLRRGIESRGGSRARATSAAFEDDLLIGWASCALIPGSNPVSAQSRVIVHPQYRSRGAGTGLVEWIHEHLKAAGAVNVRIFADPESQEWASRWGYQQTRQVHYAGIDPRLVPDLPEVPEGVQLVPLAEVDPRLVHAADEVAQRTKPGDAKIESRSYDDWLADIWKAPGMMLELSVAALKDGEVIGFTLGNGSQHKIWSQMTGTLPEYQGRGVAKLVKCAALRLAADAGVVGAYTANYDGNEPMLAVNEWLGYRRAATHSVLVCPL
ncbi:GNAT family N-acetyltransferase [Streptomyces sp. SID13031]|uniref:GNAT family N-acetyltransferase n=1 Tax=Streptomyces sp. SID13031 TaxID=2706046 RepID=UPI0013C7469A|nr:GNAT family N-acetyltransferase [Streptomyces sp. SID13031]NEA36971.1 GNAT family N-acetyltransferase [Streptomyces sp. SID13031]